MELSSRLQLTTWDRLDEAEAGRVARCLARRLPEPWHFARVERHEVADQRRPVAFFERDGAEFALIPGGSVVLGYDRSRGPDLCPGDLDSWEIVRPDLGEIADYLDKTMTPLRQSWIDPFLMEVESRDVTWSEVHGPDGQRYRRSVEITVGQVREFVHRDGFRLPTSDEWEHACRAGTRSFWWWGNRGRSGEEPYRPLPERNAFGLQIARNTYAFEWCSHPDVYRGGDGGVSCCGGEDGFPTELRLASAYFEPFPEVERADQPFSGNCRRAFPLPDR